LFERFINITKARGINVMWTFTN